MLEYWLMVVVIGLGGLMFRMAFLGGQSKISFPPLVKRGLIYVPPAVLAALALPGIILGPAGEPALEPVRLTAGVVAALLAWRFRKDLLTIGAGLAILWLGRAWLAG